MARALESGDVGLVCLSHVAYYSAALADMETITRDCGVPVLWDLSHSVGVMPIELEEWGVELAVGCTYKYLNAGPGSPAFLYVRREVQDRLRSPIQGWFGQRNQFDMDSPYDPEPGVRGFLAGTPPILDLTAIRVGAELVRDAGIASLRKKAVALTDLMVDLYDEWLAPLGFELASPRDSARRGAHVTLHHEEAWADHPRADRAGQGDPRLPRAQLDPPRGAPSLHPRGRRVGCARPPARAGGARRAPRGGRRAHSGHLILQLKSVHLWGPKVQRATGRFGRAIRTLPLTVPTARSSAILPATVTRSTRRRLPSR